MNPLDVGIIGFIILFIFLFIGFPIGITLGLVGIFGLWVLVGDAGTMLMMAVTPLRTVASYDMSVLPLFLLMAAICTASGLSKDLYNLAGKWLGRFPGGVAMASIGAAAGFAAVSSSAVATAATIGSIALPEMKKAKYDEGFSAASLAAGGTLGILIPPSFQLIIFGILTETSIGKLFIAGFIPGILQAVFYIITIYIVCKLKPAWGPPGPKSTFKEKVMAFGNCWEVIALIALVFTGITVGWFTPTEAGSMGAIGAIIFSLIRRRLTWQAFVQACISTMKMTGMVFLILIGAFIFTYFVTLSTIPTLLSNTVKDLAVPPMVVIIIIVILYLILGTAMEEASMMMLTIPIFAPIVGNLGFSLIWFGILSTRMMQLAMITPPVGITLFVIKGIAGDNVPMSKIFKGVVPFIISDVIHVTLIIALPVLSLFLPELMK